MNWLYKTAEGTQFHREQQAKQKMWEQYPEIFTQWVKSTYKPTDKITQIYLSHAQVIQQLRPLFEQIFELNITDLDYTTAIKFSNRLRTEHNYIEFLRSGEIDKALSFAKKQIFAYVGGILMEEFSQEEREVMKYRGMDIPKAPFVSPGETLQDYISKCKKIISQQRQLARVDPQRRISLPELSERERYELRKSEIPDYKRQRAKDW